MRLASLLPLSILLAACGAPPGPLPTLNPPPAAAPTVAPPVAPPPAPAGTPEPTRISQVAVQATSQAQESQLANLVAGQSLSAQQVIGVQQTAAAAQQTVTAQDSRLQGVTANQTASAQQLVAVQQTAAAEGQNVKSLQTAVANLIAAQQTAIAPKATSTPTPSNGTPVAATNTPPPTPTKLLYPWFFKRVTEPPVMCGPGFGDPCVDSAPNAGTQYISGHVIDQHGQPVSGIIVQAKSGSNPLFGTTDQNGYFSILLYTNCPTGPQSWDVYIVDGGMRLSSYVQTITYQSCTQAGEFHLDFVEVAHS